MQSEAPSERVTVYVVPKTRQAWLSRESSLIHTV